MKLSFYYKIYKFIGAGKPMRFLLDAARITRMRYLVVRFDPNWLCDLRCKMCYFSAENYHKEMMPPMSTKLFDKIAAEVFPQTKILFMGCGAEPLMSPDFIDHLDTIGRYNIPHVDVVTNGQRLTEDIVLGMIRNEINQIIISIDGFTKETYESIRTGANFEKLISNLKMIKAIKENNSCSLPTLRVNFTAMRRNYRELNELIVNAQPLGISSIRVRAMSHWGGEIDYDSEILSHIEFRDLCTSAKDVANRNNVELLYEGIYDSQSNDNNDSDEKHLPECMYPWYTIQIRGDGKIRFCPKFDYGTGDLKKQTFREFLKSKTVKDIKYNLIHNTEKSCISRCRGKFGGL